MPAAIAQTGNSSTAGPGMKAAASLRVLESLGRRVDGRDPRVVRQAAGQLLSELFFAPMLAEMREFPFGRDLVSGGLTEDTFGQQLDQRIADIVAASQPALLGAVTKHLDSTHRAAAPRSARTGAGGNVAFTTASWPVQLRLADASAGGEA